MDKPIIQSMDANPFREDNPHAVIIHVNQTVVNNNNSCMDCLYTYMCISMFSRFLCVPCVVLQCCFH